MYANLKHNYRLEHRNPWFSQVILMKKMYVPFFLICPLFP